MRSRIPAQLSELRLVMWLFHSRQHGEPFACISIARRLRDASCRTNAIAGAPGKAKPSIHAEARVLARMIVNPLPIARNRYDPVDKPARVRRS